MTTSDPIQPKITATAGNRQDPADRAEFEKLADEWELNRPRGQDLAVMAMHPAYQRIIDMGLSAVPWLLARLERRPGHWFLALNRMTGAQPVLPENEGNLKAMAEDWLRWGKQNGYEQSGYVD